MYQISALNNGGMVSDSTLSSSTPSPSYTRTFLQTIAIHSVGAVGSSGDNAKQAIEPESLTCPGTVTFRLNVRLDLSGKATTKSLCMLCTKLLLKILGEGAQAMAIWVICGDEGVGDIPGVRGGSGGVSRVQRNVARLTQELRLKV